MFLSFLDWLDEKTGGKLHGIIEFIKSSVTGAFTFIKDFIGNAMAAIKKIFTGIVKFLSGAFTSDWDKAWEGIKDIFDGISTAIKGTWASAINAIIRALNWLIDKANKSASQSQAGCRGLVASILASTSRKSTNFKSPNWPRVRSSRLTASLWPYWATRSTEPTLRPPGHHQTGRCGGARARQRPAHYHHCPNGRQGDVPADGAGKQLPGAHERQKPAADVR